MKKPARGHIVALVSALLFGLITGPVSQPVTAEAAVFSLTALKARALYFQQARKATDKALTLNSISARSTFEGKLWSTFLASWQTATSSQKLHYTVPSDLPSSGHVFIVLGAALSSKGKVTTQLQRRLKLGLAGLAAYPHSKILVTGGAAKNGVTEGKAMRAWLIAKGIPSSRILTETKSSSTVGNAKYSMAILAAHSAYTSYTLVSDASHIRRAGVLFDAAAMQIQEKSGSSWGIDRISNVAYKDKAITNPASANTTAVIASNVASLLDLTSARNALLKSPPASAVLTSLKVKALKTKYPVGSSLRKTNLVATAVYDQGTGSRVVTTAVKLAGFNASAVGTEKVKVSYTEGGVTKSTSYTVTVVKAPTEVSAKPSTTTVRKNRTVVSLKAKFSTDTGIIPTGTVRFYLGSSKLKTVTLKSSAKGVVRFTYPRIAKTGKKVLKVTFSGSSKVTSATSRVKVTVKS